MPDIFFSSKEEAPEDFRDSLVATEDGKFKINVVTNAKLAEFRDRNIEQARKLDEQTAWINKVKPIVGDDVDAFGTEVTDLRKTKRQVDDGQLKGSDNIEKEVASRVANMENDYKTQLAEMGTKLQNATEFGQTMSAKYNDSVRDREITNAVMAAESGANPEALPDFIQRARGVFTVTEDGTLVPKKGDTVLYGADGATPMSPKEWLSKELEASPYLGKSSAGGGAAGERGGEKYGGMAKADFDKTVSPSLELEARLEVETSTTPDCTVSAVYVLPKASTPSGQAQGMSMVVVENPRRLPLRVMLEPGMAPEDRARSIWRARAQRWQGVLERLGGSSS